MTDLRKTAKGRECLIRVPQWCTGNPETVVLCHYRIAGMSGMGFKNHDWCGAFGCFACHQVVDGQQRTIYTKEERDLMLLKAVIRTQAVWFEEGKLVIA